MHFGQQSPSDDQKQWLKKMDILKPVMFRASLCNYETKRKQGSPLLKKKKNINCGIDIALPTHRNKLIGESTSIPVYLCPLHYFITCKIKWFNVILWVCNKAILRKMIFYYSSFQSIIYLILINVAIHVTKNLCFSYVEMLHPDYVQIRKALKFTLYSPATALCRIPTAGMFLMTSLTVFALTTRQNRRNNYEDADTWFAVEVVLASIR